MTKKSDEFMARLVALGACYDAKKFCEGKTLATAWRTCRRPDWMLWLYARTNPDKRIAVEISIFCARLVLKNYEDKCDDKRPRLAIEAAENWLINPCELTYSAAYSAHSAADSAAHSAYSAAYSAHSAHSAADSAARSAYSAAYSAYSAYSAHSAHSAADSAARSAYSAAYSAGSSAYSAARSAADSAISNFIRSKISYKDLEE